MFSCSVSFLNRVDSVATVLKFKLIFAYVILKKTIFILMVINSFIFIPYDKHDYVTLLHFLEVLKQYQNTDYKLYIKVIIREQPVLGTAFIVMHFQQNRKIDNTVYARKSPMWHHYIGSALVFSVYLTILVRAAARLSVFLNKARIRLFISLQENSTARGPFPSAHLKKKETHFSH